MKKMNNTGNWGIAIALGLVLVFTAVAGAQPTQLIDGGLFYFPKIQSMLTVGGWGETTNWDPVQQAWTLNGNAWSSLPDLPAAITHTGGTYDEAHQRLVVMGGVFAPYQAYAYDGIGWTSIADPLPTTVVGGDPELIYDPVLQKIIVYFSPPGGNNSKSETYLLNNTTWETLNPNPAPPTAADSGFVYDSVRGEGVWFNGTETWIWNHTGWTARTPSHHPDMNGGEFNMVFDSAHSVIVLYGQGETWTWDGMDWNRLSPAQSPSEPNRGFFAMGYNDKEGKTILWGGEVVISTTPFQTSYPDDLWSWEGAIWNRLDGASVTDWFRRN